MRQQLEKLQEGKEAAEAQAADLQQQLVCVVVRGVEVVCACVCACLSA